MSLLAILYKLVPESPILVAANREEQYDYVCNTPSIQSGKPRIMGPIDDRSGGMWFGVNQHGLFVGCVERKKGGTMMASRSRGVLCRDLVRCGSARKAIDMAMEELHTGLYPGVNFVIADAESGWVVHGGHDYEVVELQPGLSVIGQNDVNDPRDERVALAHRLLTLQTLDSPVKFLAVASRVFARPSAAPGRPGMVVREPKFGTINSSLLALGKKPRDAIFQFSSGAPDEAKYEDYSPLLRDILSRGLREARTKAKA